jgi:hypothetical protein
MLSGEPDVGAGIEPLQVIGETPPATEQAPASVPVEMLPRAEAEPGVEPLPVASEAASSAEITEPKTAAPAVQEPGPTPSSPDPRLPAEQLAALVARGDGFVQMRDLTSARLYFERAAEAGDGRAALRMGETFDPAFLARAGIRGVQGDRQQAILWYQRARERGEAEATRRLEEIQRP